MATYNEMSAAASEQGAAWAALDDLFLRYGMTEAEAAEAARLRAKGVSCAAQVRELNAAWERWLAADAKAVEVLGDPGVSQVAARKAGAKRQFDAAYAGIAKVHAERKALVAAR